MLYNTSMRSSAEPDEKETKGPRSTKVEYRNGRQKETPNAHGRRKVSPCALFVPNTLPLFTVQASMVRNAEQR